MFGNLELLQSQTCPRFVRRVLLRLRPIQMMVKNIEKELVEGPAVDKTVEVRFMHTVFTATSESGKKKAHVMSIFVNSKMTKKIHFL